MSGGCICNCSTWHMHFAHKLCFIILLLCIHDIYSIYTRYVHDITLTVIIKLMLRNYNSALRLYFTNSQNINQSAHLSLNNEEQQLTIQYLPRKFYTKKRPFSSGPFSKNLIFVAGYLYLKSKTVRMIRECALRQNFG